MAKYEGNCFMCGKTAGRIALKNHMLKEHNKGSEACYLIRAESRYQGWPYWLFFTAPINAELKDVDCFLRSIWLECCEHLSVFSDKWTEEYSMKTKLSRFNIGDMLDYDYDFGTTTGLFVTFLDKISRFEQKDVIQLLARNLPIEEKCSTCDQPALYTDKSVWEKSLACESCYEENKSDESFYLPLTNSPRSGECGYDGGQDQWTFDQKGAFPQPPK